MPSIYSYLGCDSYSDDRDDDGPTAAEEEDMAQAAADEQLDRERDAYHAAQDALEQEWLGEVYAEADDHTKCTCGAVNSFYEPAYFYCVCDL